MWRTHLVILGMLVLLAGPVLLLDRQLLQYRGGPLPVALGGTFITAYLLWLAVQAFLSTGLVLGFRTTSPAWLHVASAPLAVALLIAGAVACSGIESRRAAREREARLDARAGYADAVRLTEWRLVADDGPAGRVEIRVAFEQSGRFAAFMEGRSADGRQVFTAEMKNQRQVAAGEEVSEVLRLARYLDEPATELKIRLWLFKDDNGSAPEDIRMIYRTGLTAREDDGRHFHVPLPPQSKP